MGSPVTQEDPLKRPLKEPLKEGPLRVLHRRKSPGFWLSHLAEVLCKFVLGPRVAGVCVTESGWQPGQLKLVRDLARLQAEGQVVLSNAGEARHFHPCKEPPHRPQSVEPTCERVPVNLPSFAALVGVSRNSQPYTVKFRRDCFPSMPCT